MAFRTKKISQMDPKGASLASTDLLEISELVSGSYVTKSITGAEIITGATTGFVPTTRTLTINGTTQDLSADRTFTVATGITIGTTAITSGVVGRVLFEGAGNVVQESSGLTYNDTTKAFQISGNQNATTKINVSNTTSGITSTAEYNLTSDAIAGIYNFGKASSTYSPYKIITASNGYIYNGVSGDIAILNDVASGRIKFSAGASATAQMTLVNTGNVLINTTTDAGFRLDVNGTARVDQMTFPPTLDKKIFLYQGITDYAIGLAAGAIRLGTPAGNRVAMGNYTGATFTEICNVSPTGLNLLSGRVDLGADVSNVKLAIYTSAGISMGLGVSPATFRFSAGGTTNNFVFFDDAAGNKLYSLISLTGAGYYGSGTVNASAQLQVDSTNRGFLPPRMTTTQKNAIATPTAGLQLFDTTTLTPSIYNGTNWQNLLVPNSTGNVLINTTTDAGFRLDVNGTARVVGNTQLDSGIIATSAATTRLQGSINYFTHNRILSSGVFGFQISRFGNPESFWRHNDGSGNIEFGNIANAALTLYTNNTVKLFIGGGGQVGIGTITPSANAVLDLTSTSRGFLPPRMTTTEKNAIATPVAGLMVYDNVLNRPCFYNGTTWITL